MASAGAYLDSTKLVMPGTSGNYASTPDSNPLDVILLDLDLRIKCAATDWTPSTQQSLIGKYGASGQRSYLLSLRTDGKLLFRWSESGSSATSEISSVATGLSDGSTKWLRVAVDRDNGSSNHVVKFYMSDDGISWSQLGSTLTSIPDFVFKNSTTKLEIGSSVTGTSELFVGSIFYAEVRDNILDDGTGIVFQADFTAQLAATQTFAETSSNAATVTINSTDPLSFGNYWRGTTNVPSLASNWSCNHTPGSSDIARLHYAVASWTNAPVDDSVALTWASLIITDGGDATIDFGHVTVNGNVSAIAISNNGTYDLRLKSINGDCDITDNISVVYLTDENDAATCTAKHFTSLVDGGDTTAQYIFASDSTGTMKVGTGFAGLITNSRSSPTVNRVDMNNSPIASRVIFSNYLHFFNYLVPSTINYIDRFGGSIASSTKFNNTNISYRTRQNFADGVNKTNFAINHIILNASPLLTNKGVILQGENSEYDLGSDNAIISNRPSFETPNGPQHN